jgi:hypothetical protein
MKRERIRRYVEGDPTPGRYILFGMETDSILLVGDLASRPQWLVDIVSVGRVSPEGMNFARPPPDFVLWFVVDDDDNNLVRLGTD